MELAATFVPFDVCGLVAGDEFPIGDEEFRTLDRSGGEGGGAEVGDEERGAGGRGAEERGAGFGDNLVRERTAEYGAHGKAGVEGVGIERQGTTFL